MKHRLFILIFLYAPLISSCTSPLYFDSAPKNNSKEVSNILKKGATLIGTYQLEINGLTNNSDNFKSNNFNNYAPPPLKNTTEDTAQYLVESLVLGNRYLQISENNGVCHFLHFDCVNEKIFHHFFSSGKRLLEKKSDTSCTYVSALFENDSIKLEILEENNKKKVTHDTIIKFQAWQRGELICFSSLNGGLFDPKFIIDSIDLKSPSTNSFAYLTALHNQLYFIKKDTTNNEIKFTIENYRIDTSGFTVRELSQLENMGGIADALGIKYCDGLMHYDETKLESIFNSSLARNEIIAKRIKNFPALYETKNNIISIILKCIGVIGGITLLIFILVWFARTKQVLHRD